MDDGRPLHERVAALERAVTDGHADDGLPDAGRLAARVDDLEATVEEFDDRMAELDAAVQALRGFAGGVHAVDEEVERRANAAISRVERLEAELESVAVEVPAEEESVAGTDTNADTDADRHQTNAGPRDGVASGGRVGAQDGAVTGRVGRANSDGDGDGGSGRTGTTTHNETLREEVTARSDAALAEVVTSGERSRSEADDDPSLADRLRRLL